MCRYVCILMAASKLKEKMLHHSPWNVSPTVCRKNKGNALFISVLSVASSCFCADFTVPGKLLMLALQDIQAVLLQHSRSLFPWRELCLLTEDSRGAFQVPGVLDSGEPSAFAPVWPSDPPPFCSCCLFCYCATF